MGGTRRHRRRFSEGTHAFTTKQHRWEFGCRSSGGAYASLRQKHGRHHHIAAKALTEDDRKLALLSHRHVPTPMAPELGLFLCECIFGAYNDRFGSVHDALQLDKYAEKSENFKRTHVYTHIANQEREQNTLRHWIRDTLHAKQLRAAFDASMDVTKQAT